MNIKNQAKKTLTIKSKGSFLLLFSIFFQENSKGTNEAPTYRTIIEEKKIIGNNGVTIFEKTERIEEDYTDTSDSESELESESSSDSDLSYSNYGSKELDRNNFFEIIVSPFQNFSNFFRNLFYNNEGGAMGESITCINNNGQVSCMEKIEFGEENSLNNETSVEKEEVLSKEKIQTPIIEAIANLVNLPIVEKNEEKNIIPENSMILKKETLLNGEEKNQLTTTEEKNQPTIIEEK